MDYSYCYFCAQIIVDEWYIEKISNIYRYDSMKKYENDGKDSKIKINIQYLLKYYCCVPIYIVIRLLRKLIRGKDYFNQCDALFE